MRIDVSNIAKTNGASITVDFEYKIEDIGILDINIYKPIHFTGILENISGMIRVTGDLVLEYNIICSRCLKAILKKVTIKVFENFMVSSKKAEEDDFYTFNGKYIELIDVINDNIILYLPIKEVCDSNCKGLCKKCGKDLNIEDCECKDENIDPRFLVLNDLKKNKTTEHY